MRKTKFWCLFLALLSLLSLCACSAANSSDMPEEESGSPVFSSQTEESESGEAENTPSAPAVSPSAASTTSPAPVYPELPLPVEEIYFLKGGFAPDAWVGYDENGIFMRTFDLPSEIKKSDQIVAFRFSFFSIRSFGVYKNDLEEYILLLDEIALGKKSYSEITDRGVKKLCFDEQGQPLPEVLSAEKERAQHGLEITNHVLEAGPEAVALEVKEDWLKRCKEKGITAIDTGKDYLYIFCTNEQLLSLATPLEQRLGLYVIYFPSLQTYLEDRVNIVK